MQEACFFEGRLKKWQAFQTLAEHPRRTLILVIGLLKSQGIFLGAFLLLVLTTSLTSVTLLSIISLEILYNCRSNVSNSISGCQSDSEEYLPCEIVPIFWFT